MRSETMLMMTRAVPPPRERTPVLVTGCSSGIGRATALRLVKAGFPVVATARETASLGELALAGCSTAALDVTKSESFEEVVGPIEAEFGAVGGLVNNAGYSQSGAVESVSEEQANRQMQTNLMGPIALARRVLPAMREAGWGRIVNVSSMGGRFSFPGAGWYHASKHGLEAISDSLRFEEAGFGIGVVLIEPGWIRSRFADRVTEELPPATGDGAFETFDASVAVLTKSAYEGGFLARLGGEPDDVARAIEKAVTGRRPRPRVLVTPSARVMVLVHAVLTDRGWDRFVARSFPTPAAGRSD